MYRPPPMRTLFPYTTLFRSRRIQFERSLPLRREPRIEAHQRPVAGLDRELLLVESEVQWKSVGDAVRVRDHEGGPVIRFGLDRKSTRLNSSHANISYAVFCL